MAGVLGRAFVQVFADLSKFTPDLKRNLQSALDESGKSASFKELTSTAEKAGEEASDELSKGLDRKNRNNLRQAGQRAGDYFKRGFTMALSGVAAAAFPALIAVAVEAAAYLAPLAVALGATLPAAIMTLVGTVAVLKIAFSGVGQAIKDAFDPSKAAQLNAEMKKLAPAAREFVTEIRKMGPQFKALKQDIQQTFFVQFEGSLTRLVRNVLPTVRAGLHGISADLGQLTKNLLGTLSNRKGDIASIFIAADKALRPFIPLVGQLAGAFVTLGAVAGPFMADLSAGLARVGARFAAFIENSANSGGLAGFFEGAEAVLSNVAGLLGQVGTLIGNIVQALTTSGGQAFGIVTELIKELNAFLGTAEGKADLASIFDLLNIALDSLRQILTPLIPLVGELAKSLGSDLGKVIKDITPWLVKIADFMAAHPKAVKDVIEAYALFRVAMAAATAVQIAFDIAAAANPIGLIIIGIALSIAWIVILIMHWRDLLHDGEVVLSFFGRFFTGIWSWIKGVGSDIADFFTKTVPGFFESLPGKIWTAVQAIPGLLKTALVDVLQGIGFQIGLFVGLVIAWFTKMPGLVWNALKDFGGFMAKIFSDAWDWVVRTVSNGVDRAIAFFKALPGRALAEIRALPGQLRSLMTTAWNWVVQATENGANRVVSFARGLPGRLAGFFRNVGSTVLDGLKGGINAVIRGFNQGINKVGGFLHIGLPNIPQLATGGLVNSPTLALVGEAGPEAVVPMGNPAKALQVAGQTGLLSMLSSALGQMGPGVPVVHVYIGDKEITEIVDVRVEHRMDQQASALTYGPRSS